MSLGYSFFFNHKFLVTYLFRRPPPPPQLRPKFCSSEPWLAGSAQPSPPHRPRCRCIERRGLRHRGCCHWRGVRRASFEGNREEAAETGGLSRHHRPPGANFGSPSDPEPSGQWSRMPNSLTKRGTFRMAVVGKSVRRSAAAFAPIDLAPISLPPSCSVRTAPPARFTGRKASQPRDPPGKPVISARLT